MFHVESYTVEAWENKPVKIRTKFGVKLSCLHTM